MADALLSLSVLLLLFPVRFNTLFSLSSILPPPLCLSHFLSFHQMPPHSTSSTARRHRTLRSCDSLAPMSCLCVRRMRRLLLPHLSPHLLLPADLFLPSPRSHTPTPGPTKALSLVVKACLSQSPPGTKAGLPLHVCQSPSHSRPHCGGNCRLSGIVLNWRSLEKMRGDCRR